MATFTWTPDIGAVCQHQPRIREIKMGDGYEQRAQDGLNADMELWPLTFSGRSILEAGAIDAFLITAGGTASFDWQAPEATTTKKYVCQKWSRKRDSYASQTITAEFRQVPV